MGRSYRRQIAVVLAALRSNHELRRVQLAFAGFTSAEWAVWIATLVFAYDHGGAAASGLVALAQLAPATLFAPYAGALGDRHPRGSVLFWGYAGQCVGYGAMAVAVLATAPPVAVYACAVGATLAIDHHPADPVGAAPRARARSRGADRRQRRRGLGGGRHRAGGARRRRRRPDARRAGRGVRAVRG